MARRLHVLSWMRPRLAGRSGYTVLELLLVMVIIAIIAAITYVRVAPALSRARVRGAASVLATDLQYAQVLAARYRTPMQIAVNTVAMSYQIVDVIGGTVYRERRFGAGGEYGLAEFGASPTTVRVFPNAVVAQSSQYTLGRDGYRRRVTFSRAGQIRVATVP
jgi:prepilin-type N-terminal cleavage/methylation domain-containing protein